MPRSSVLAPILRSLMVQAELKVCVGGGGEKVSYQGEGDQEACEEREVGAGAEASSSIVGLFCLSGARDEHHLPQGGDWEPLWQPASSQDTMVAIQATQAICHHRQLKIGL